MLFWAPKHFGLPLMLPIPCFHALCVPSSPYKLVLPPHMSNYGANKMEKLEKLKSKVWM